MNLCQFSDHGLHSYMDHFLSHALTRYIFASCSFSCLLHNIIAWWDQIGSSVGLVRRARVVSIGAVLEIALIWVVYGRYSSVGIARMRKPVVVSLNLSQLIFIYIKKWEERKVQVDLNNPRRITGRHGWYVFLFCLFLNMVVFFCKVKSWKDRMYWNKTFYLRW